MTNISIEEGCKLIEEKLNSDAYEMTKADFLEYIRSCYIGMGLTKKSLRSSTIIDFGDKHKQAVHKALKRRVYVPPDVLKEYQIHS